MSGCRLFTEKPNLAAQEKDVERSFKQYRQRSESFVESEVPKHANDVIYECHEKELFIKKLTT